MNAERLLALYDRVADAPDAVGRLRRFVLDLAVRGKLVEQNPVDEPASELLKRIAAERAWMVKAGEIKAKKPPPDSTSDEVSMSLPSGWSSVRLAEITACLDYMRKPINATERAKRIEGKGPDELFPYYGATQQQGWIDDYLFDEELVLLGEDGVPFLDPYRPKAYLIRGKTWVNNHAHVFRGILVSHPYLVHVLNVFDYSGRVAGATRAKLNQTRALGIPIPLPPLAEQHRIVAKVDEFMALCDRLEDTRAAHEDTRERLTKASYARLTVPDTDGRTFRSHARFAVDALPALTAYSDQVKHLRQAILSLAVRGKLVEQDPVDEPASELLKRIAAERAWMVKAGEIKAKKPPPDSTSDEVSMSLPSGWSSVRLAEITACLDYMRKPINATERAKRIEGKGPDELFPYYGATQQQGWIDDYLFDEELVLLGEDGVPFLDPYRPKAYLIRGKTWVNNHAHVFRGILVSHPYLVHVLNVFDYSGRVAGATRAKLNQTRALGIPIPLPPLAEQHRIVAKVDELMALCGRLEAGLTALHGTASNLLGSLLQESLGNHEATTNGKNGGATRAGRGMRGCP